MLDSKRNKYWLYCKDLEKSLLMPKMLIMWYFQVNISTGARLSVGVVGFALMFLMSDMC